MATHEQTALLFKPGDAADLAHQIAPFHDDPELAQRLGRAARQRALATFDVETHARKVQAVYDQVLR